ncbi:MAG: serine hydrolase domain-containing protein [Pseudomonadota bacterium]
MPTRSRNTQFSLTRRDALWAGLAVAALPAFAGCQNSSATFSRPSDKQDHFIRTRMAALKVPGVAVVKIEDGTVAWERGFGVGNVETGELITERTLFQAASLSKPIFAYVVMQAVDQGVIGLDDRLIDYAQPRGKSDHPWLSEVTVRDALQHTTGLPNWRPMEEDLALTPSYKPGTASSYSGEAFHWVQLAIENITRKGLDTLMREYLFAPARLNDMSMLWEASRDQREVYGHTTDERGSVVLSDIQFAREQGLRLNEVAERWGRPMRLWTVSDQLRALSQMRPHTHERARHRPPWRWTHPNYLQINSPATLRCAAGDYARFACLMMPGRSQSAWELSEATRQFILTPQFERPDVQGGVLPRGIGWGLERRDDGIAYYHWGSNSNTHISVIVADTSDRSGLVVMTNAGAGRQLIKDVVLELTGKNYIGVSTS